MKTYLTICLLVLGGMAFGQVADSVGTDKESERIAWGEKHNPRLASILSATIPGAGQIYNRKYWKAPIVWGGIGVSIYYIDLNQTKFKMYRTALLAITDDDPTTLDPFNGQFSQNFIEASMDFHRRFRDLSYIGLALVYVLNIVDANIDAHFARFDVSDDLTMQFYPSITSPLSQTPSLSVAFALH